ncbi:TIGR04076 family protein [Candidatus Bathyarchaeota archaeon]|nr:TIGR04076 family protein [Candidatus Bathyarchaeota archaeon]
MPRNRVKVTVQKCVDPKIIFDSNVPNMPGKDEPYKKCGLKEGTSWVVEKNLRMPEGFCSWAWRDLYKDISVMVMGGDFDPWVEKGLMYTSCTDGIRPVSFKLERLED